ncbi:MAG: bile acid:sodium symporter family protein [Synechococcus sp. SB0666_bin_14]|nr:bile acid:sodium symporter family protein [Synechococcus sp. SB0666_bin_14]MYG47029.1 bile acid:sodium symporter family protein [Synechococcus sp. SB0675_bin_6]MYJ59332.1 bile acid:sodium symporter family protein [Synechococcus sp. SB0672_bin_6]MYK91549.1 bile acid:sodium symporter family protein [Synechococcus sp. SB0669_bin_8]
MGQLIDVGLPVALAFIMFSLGLGLTIDDFFRVARQPRDVLVGLFSQVVLLPIVGFALASTWPLAPELALGVMLIAAVPGGVTSNVLTAFAGGDVALSISLTAVTSVVSVVTVPLIVALSHHRFMGGDSLGDFSVASTALQVFAIVTLPVMLGVLTHRLAEPAARRLRPKARTLSMVLFVLVLVGAVVGARDAIVPYFAQAGLVTLVLNVVMMVVAWTVARGLASGPKQRIAVTIECGLQNGTMAIAVGVLLFGGGLTVVPAATYSLTMFATALLYLGGLRCRGS